MKLGFKKCEYLWKLKMDDEDLNIILNILLNVV